MASNWNLTYKILNRLSKKSSNVIVAISVLLLGVLLTACNSTTSNPESAQASQINNYSGKKILWVDSYHQGYEWSDGIETGLRSVLDDSGAEFKVIRMDTKRNESDEFGAEAALAAKTEIEGFQPDVVIASDDNAQKYLVVPYYKNTDVPVIFAGVNWDASVYGYPTDNITGMIEVELPAQLVSHLKSYADGDRVAYLTVDSVTERKVADVYNDRFFNGEMRVEYVKTWDEYKEAFLKLQDEVDVLFLGNNAGIDKWEEAEAKEFFMENTKIPTGSINPWFTPYALITLAKRPEEQGEWAAQTALDIVDGAAISDIPITENKDGHLILNFDLVEKLDVVFSPTLLKNAEVYSSEEQ